MVEMIRYNENPCPRCGEPIGLRGWQAKYCEDCARKHKKKGDKERKRVARTTDAHKTWYRNYMLNKLYGISLDEFNALFVAQGSQCAICPATEPGERDWNLDHCHKTGQNRGILCNKCNLMLGMVGDDVEILLQAINYLQKFA